MWVDSHSHLYLRQFDEDRSAVMQRAHEAEIRHIFLPDIDSTTSSRVDQLVSEYPEVCHKMSGLHPCSVKDNVTYELDHVRRRLFEDEDVVALGEVGLDYYWDKSYVEEQKDAFERQIEWARELDLPIIIHSRDSLDDTISTIEKLSRGDLRGSAERLRCG